MNRLKKTLFVLGIALIGIGSARAQLMQHLSMTQPGGMPGTNLITGVLLSSNNMTVTWDGPSGYYQLFEQPSAGARRVALTTARNLKRFATISLRYSNALFSVVGPAPHYAASGPQACQGCHASIVKSQAHTLHAGAFTNSDFAASDGQTNSSCLACHTVGNGVSTGFTSLEKTPKLAGVFCEDCHGTAANHAVNPGNVAVKPRAEIAATVCGGCHVATYGELNMSGHPYVVEDMNPKTRISACGRCHSGSARLSLLQKRSLPVGDADVGITCITCHDPHQTNSNPAQLRNPVYSTNDYSIATSDAFLKKYNPNINVCAQCHNRRGASWTDTSRAPHLSPQYNILLGTIDEQESGLPHYQPGSHALYITNQCVGCHMTAETVQTGDQPAFSSHSHDFQVKSFDLCIQCHPAATNLISFARTAMGNNIQDIKDELDFWATNAAPPALSAKYGTRAWEYTIPGSLSPAGSGPTAAEQKLIPDNIKKARFNLYLVVSDGSSGIHNPLYCIDLLTAAENFIVEELSQ